MRNRGLCLRTKNDFRSGTLLKLAMPADKIRVQVRFDDVFNFQILRGCFVHVLIDVALRIYYRGFTCRANQIGSVSETVEIELFEIHKPPKASGPHTPPPSTQQSSLTPLSAPAFSLLPLPP